MSSLVEIGPVVLEKKMKISSVYFHSFVISPLEKGRVLRLNKLESPLPKDGLYQVWLILEKKKKM